MSAEANAERLDALLTLRLRGGPSLPRNPGDAELAPFLEVAGRLATLSQAQPSLAFTHDLEARMLAHVERLGHPGRARQVVPPVSLSHRSLRRFRWPAAAAAVLLVGVGTLTAAASAGPGSPLAGLSHLEEGVRIQLAQGPSDRAQVHLHYAQQALDSLRGGVTGGEYRAALAQLKMELAAANADLGSMPSGSSYTTLATQLASLQAQARQVLLSGLAGRDWSDRLAASGVLGSLGVTLPSIDHVTVTAPPDAAATESAAPRSVQIEITGSGFAPGATLYLNGQPVGTVDTLTPTAITASETTLAAHDITSVGIGNPDGTATSTTALTYAGGNGAAGHPGTGSGGGNGSGNGQGSGNGKGQGAGAQPTPSPNGNGSGNGSGGGQGNHGGDHGTPTPTPDR